MYIFAKYIELEEKLQIKEKKKEPERKMGKGYQQIIHRRNTNKHENVLDFICT